MCALRTAASPDMRTNPPLLQLADEQWGVIGLKWKEASCDKLGVVDGSSDGSNDNQGSGNNGNNDTVQADAGSNSNQQDDSQSSKLDGHSGWDTAWIKQKIQSFGKVSDSDFEKRWQDAVDGTWLDKFKSEGPSWVK